ncbi:hypothetical protein HK101_000286 [Irineochytrium annulatum]|nr:hypothetical protein HK101_000286 [Irineochytrium annulatum]
MANAAKLGEAAWGGKKANLREFNDFDPWSKLPPQQQEPWNEKARRMNEGGELSTFEQELATKIFVKSLQKFKKSADVAGVDIIGLFCVNGSTKVWIEVMTVDNWQFDEELKISQRTKHHMERIADGLDGSVPYENEKIVFRVRGDDDGPL